MVVVVLRREELLTYLLAIMSSLVRCDCSVCWRMEAGARSSPVAEVERGVEIVWISAAQKYRQMIEGVKSGPQAHSLLAVGVQ